MSQSIEELLAYYSSLGAPQEQTPLVGLLKAVQAENGGAVPRTALQIIAAAYSIKDSYLYALIKRIPSLRLADSHLLEICCGQNCGKNKSLAAFAKTLQGENITVKFVPCMRLCGKGPNIKWDGKLYHQVDESILLQLTKG